MATARKFDSVIQNGIPQKESNESDSSAQFNGVTKKGEFSYGRAKPTLNGALENNG